MEIRFAKPQDVPGIIKLLQQAGSAHHELRPDLFSCSAQKYSPSQVLSMLDKLETPIFVAVEEDRVLGYGFCKLEQYRNHPVMNDRFTLCIDDLWVLEECRDVGAALYQKILEYAKYRGCYNVTLDVWNCNEDAVKCYESLGMNPQKTAMEAIL